MYGLVLMFTLASEMFPPLNEMLELVLMPTSTVRLWWTIRSNIAHQLMR